MAQPDYKNLLNRLLDQLTPIVSAHDKGSNIPKSSMTALIKQYREVSDDLKQVVDPQIELSILKNRIAELEKEVAEPILCTVGRFAEKMADAARPPATWREFVEKAPQFSQRQDSTTDQLKDLRLVANRLGFYDAADYLRDVEINSLPQDQMWIKPPEDYDKRIYLVWFEGDAYCPRLCWPNAGQWNAFNTNSVDQIALGKALRVLEYHIPTDKEWKDWCAPEPHHE